MPETEIVINTGPIISLVAATGDLSLLPRLYSRVIVPREVCDEVLANDGMMRGAVELSSSTGIELRNEPRTIMPPLNELLDRGEAAVIQLALDEGFTTVCIDEQAGRRVARLCGLKVTGSLGVLIRAKREGHNLCLSDAIVRLREAGIFLSDRLIETALRAAGEVSGE